MMYPNDVLSGVTSWIAQPPSEEQLVLLDDYEKREGETSNADQRSLIQPRNLLSIAFGAITSIGYALRPRFLDARTARKLHPTSYLDGLRGCAAFIVMLYHLQERFYRGIVPGYGSSATATNPFSLPIIRVLFGGGSMVGIFFVVSGYVLSTKPLRLARQNRPEEVYECTASSAFRRGPRLYIPSMAQALMMTFLAQAHIIDQHYYGANPDGLLAGLAGWVKASSRFISPFGGRDTAYPIEGVTWTIPIEFRGSLLIYLSCFSLARSSCRFRFTFLLGMALFWLWHGVWELFLFSMGMVAADTHFLYAPPGTDATRRHSRRMRTIHLILVFISLYLLSCPEYSEGLANTPGFVTLSTTLTPDNWRGGNGPSRFWPAVAAPLLILTMDHAGPESIYQRIFTTDIAQWLGEISFSLYLCHGSVMHTIGDMVIPWVCRFLGIDYGAGISGNGSPLYFLAIAAAMMAGLPVLFYVSSIMTEVLDKGSVRFAKRISTW